VPQDIIALGGTVPNFLSPTAEFGYSYNGVVKLDHQFNDKHHLYLRWFGGQGNQTAPTGVQPRTRTANSNLVYYFGGRSINVFNYSAVLIPLSFSHDIRSSSRKLLQSVFHDFNNSFVPAKIGLSLADASTAADRRSSNLRIKDSSRPGITDPKAAVTLPGTRTISSLTTTGAHQFRFGGEIRQAHLMLSIIAAAPVASSFDGTQETKPNALQRHRGLKNCAWESKTPDYKPAVVQCLVSKAWIARQDLSLTSSQAPSQLLVLRWRPDRWVKVNASTFTSRTAGKSEKLA